MSIPTDLTPRFEVRKLETKHLPSASAILCHTSHFHSPFWPIVYPDNKTKLCCDVYNAVEYLVRTAIDSGLSYGVFDKEWKYKHPDSAATDGAVYWDQTNPTAASEQLLEQIDSPLVSICLAYDGFYPLDLDKLKDFFGLLPLFPIMHEHLHKLDKRDPKSWEPTEPGQVIMRTGTSTRPDYEGLGLMKLMAHWEMKDAAAKGFRGINMESLHPAVDHVWMNPPAPFKATRVGIFNMNELIIEKDREQVAACPQVDVLAGRMYVELR